MHRNLYSYREKISTEDALHNLVHKIEKALENKQVAIVLFLDIDAAFSSASTLAMINNLKKLGVEPEIVNWTADMLNNRTATATLLNETVQKIVERV